MRTVGRRILIGAAALLSFCATLPAETLYLKSEARAEGQATFGELLLRPSQRPELNSLPLPVDSAAGAVYLPAGGLSALLPEAGINLVGRGVWLFGDAAADFFTPELRGALAELFADENAAVLFSAEELAKLGNSSAENGLDLRLSGGGTRVLISEERRLSGVLAVEKVKLTPDQVEVRAGSRVMVRIFRGGLVIEAEGRTGRSARVGEQVPVTLNQTRKRVEALLTTDATAEIFL